MSTSADEIGLARPGDEAALQAFLQRRLASSMFFLSNLNQAGLTADGQIDPGQRGSGAYAVAWLGDDVVGVAAQFVNNSVHLQAPPLLVPDLVETLLGATGRPLRGLIGPLAQVQAAERLRPPGVQVQIDEIDDLLTLILGLIRLPDGLQDGSLHGRLAQADDIDLLASWRRDYLVEVQNLDETRADSAQAQQQRRRYLEQLVAAGDIFLLEDGGRPVATCAYTARIPEAVLLGGVWTPDALRGEGYGRAVVAAALLNARDEGAGLGVLFADVNNEAAQTAYRSLGFDRTGDFRILLFQRP
ncbi:MAG: GNAT family N-acetyltransferase [Candidatus Promineifilaceae bacterium]|nr:GNAT family N-acetyltransferase [Candidatus Promineifilaceae bacterium]